MSISIPSVRGLEHVEGFEALYCFQDRPTVRRAIHHWVYGMQWLVVQGPFTLEQHKVCVRKCGSEYNTVRSEHSP
jgi:hypothetical protein